MTDDIPRTAKGQFAKGAGFDSERAKKARAAQKRMSSKDFEQKVDSLLEEAGRGKKGANATETERMLAEKAIKGNQSDMRLFLSQTGQLQTPDSKYDGIGPCPTCGQVPGEGLLLTGAQLGSMEESLGRLRKAIEASEALLKQERKLDAQLQEA